MIEQNRHKLPLAPVILPQDEKFRRRELLYGNLQGLGLTSTIFSARELMQQNTNQAFAMYLFYCTLASVALCVANLNFNSLHENRYRTDKQSSPVSRSSNNSVRSGEIYNK